MKKLVVLLLLIPCTLTAQKAKKNFFYIAAGFFAGSNRNSLFMPAVGGGIKNKLGSVGASVYYNTRFSLSTNLDFRAISNKGKKTSPFISIQPGISLYRKNNTLSKTSGGFDFKGLIGVMEKESKGLYLSVGYYTFTIKTTYTGGTNSGSISGFLVNAGINF